MLENTAKQIKQEGWNKQQQGDLKFLFLGRRMFFLFSTKLPLNLCACHCISYILKLLCILFAMFVICSVILENNIQIFTFIDSVQKQNTVYTFQLKSF